jgi:hypothetical protein
MKLTHVEDIEAIGFFNDYKKTLDKDNVSPELFTNLQKHFSCQFPSISDFVKNKVSKSSERFFSTIFYGDPNFYELKDV